MQRNVTLLLAVNLLLLVFCKNYREASAKKKQPLNWVLYNHRRRMSHCSKGTLRHGRGENRLKFNTQRRDLPKVPGAWQLL